MASAGLSRRALLAGLSLAVTAARGELADLISKTRASVLPVGTYDALKSPRFTFRGSGFVVGGGSLLVTNAHVLPDSGTGPPPQLAVLVPPAGVGGGDVRMARLESLDSAHDLALLGIDGAALPALELAEPDAVREGMEVALLGFPIGGVLGYSMVTHRGIVSSITSIALPSLNAAQLNARAVERLRAGPFEVYQLDATAYPGNSGGPLLDAHTGRVIGIVNMVLVRSTRESALANPTGITYAIPSRFISALLKER